jgi:hypothetical protein
LAEFGGVKEALAQKMLYYSSKSQTRWPQPRLLKNFHLGLTQFKNNPMDMAKSLAMPA